MLFLFLFKYFDIYCVIYFKFLTGFGVFNKKEKVKLEFEIFFQTTFSFFPNLKLDTKKFNLFNKIVK
jgi:hypothetical protein